MSDEAVPTTNVENETPQPFYDVIMSEGAVGMVEQFAAIVKLADHIEDGVNRLLELETEGIPIRTEGLATVEIGDIDGSLISWGLQTIAFFNPSLKDEAFKTFNKFQEASARRGEITGEDKERAAAASARIAQRKLVESLVALGVSMGVPEEQARAEAQQYIDAADADSLSEESDALGQRIENEWNADDPALD